MLTSSLSASGFQDSFPQNTDVFHRWDPVAPLLKQNNSILSQVYRKYTVNKVLAIFGYFPHHFSFFKMSFFSPVQIKLISKWQENINKTIYKNSFVGNTYNYTNKSSPVPTWPTRTKPTDTADQAKGGIWPKCSQNIDKAGGQHHGLHSQAELGWTPRNVWPGASSWTRPSCGFLICDNSAYLPRSLKGLNQIILVTHWAQCWTHGKCSVNVTVIITNILHFYLERRALPKHRLW